MNVEAEALKKLETCNDRVVELTPLAPSSFTCQQRNLAIVASFLFCNCIRIVDDSLQIPVRFPAGVVTSHAHIRCHTIQSHKAPAGPSTHIHTHRTNHTRRYSIVRKSVSHGELLTQTTARAGVQHLRAVFPGLEMPHIAVIAARHCETAGSKKEVYCPTDRICRSTARNSSPSSCRRCGGCWELL